MKLETKYFVQSILKTLVSVISAWYITLKAFNVSVLTKFYAGSAQCIFWYQATKICIKYYI